VGLLVDPVDADRDIMRPDRLAVLDAARARREKIEAVAGIGLRQPLGFGPRADVAVVLIDRRAPTSAPYQPETGAGLIGHAPRTFVAAANASKASLSPPAHM